VGLFNVILACQFIIATEVQFSQKEVKWIQMDGRKKRYIQRYAETIPKLRFPPLSSLALRPKIEANEESGSCIDWSVALPGR
jgi:hypothetical protein